MASETKRLMDEIVKINSSELYARKVYLDGARDDLKRARVELARAEKAADKAQEDYDRLVYIAMEYITPLMGLGGK